MRERERERVRRPCHITYDTIISLENLLVSWREFLRGKRKRKDVAGFSITFMDNILKLHKELKEKTYKHRSYQAFKINDPKPRDIHKATVRDRIVHHAIYRTLYLYFDKKFIYDSYSCRNNKGTHKAINRFRRTVWKVSQNDSRTAWVLKCDIKKFFASINHDILKNILSRHIVNKDVLWLLGQIIDSFHAKNGYPTGLPLGNVISQLLINIYMNEFDQFLKRNLKIRFYIRYADDFVIFHSQKDYLEKLLPKISQYLENQLKLSLHQKKVFIKSISSGIDFLGWVNFPHHRVLRTATKRRMFNKLRLKHSNGSITSYLGMLSHGNAYKLKLKLYEQYGQFFKEQIE